jgi:hypothetical protein
VAAAAIANVDFFAILMKAVDALLFALTAAAPNCFTPMAPVRNLAMKPGRF